MSARALRRPSRAHAMLALGALLLEAAAALFALDASGVFDSRVYSTPDTGTAFNVASLLGGGRPIAPPSDAGGPPVARLRIPRIKVDADVITKGIGPDGSMEVPDNATDVAWYGFSARPGTGGNAVFSGHVDFHGVGPAVFWDLGKLDEGDTIEVALADGTTYDYAVAGKGVFEADNAPVDQIVGPTDGDAVTIITCTGTFNRSTHQYDKRLVVRAERADASLPPGATRKRTSSDAG